MAMLRILMSLAAIAMLLGLAMATDYTVGGPNGGWDPTSDLQAWAASKTFFVGDNLIFTYAPSHSVLEVTKAAFDSCEITSPIAIYTGGMTTITLASVGKRYFICGTGGHCTVGGMKLEINTLPKTFPPPPAKPATPPKTTPKAPPPSTPSSPPPTPKTPPPSSPTTSPPSKPTIPPASAPSTTPVASPPTSSLSPKSSPAPSPKHAHKISPALSPSKSSLAQSPAMPPTGVPTSPTDEAPGLPPSVESVGLPPSDAPAPTPSAPSSADKISVIAGSTVGFGFVVMQMFLL
ncbi:uclacyanin 1-like [Lycium ferocissimum]|uniref:uclacyanin 1-like n=1 Tax=Lycium ferocissimum TaxID=112874 RepID=UPI0028154209|nr:uclacyanin 1-like [Lycium ferocissimum]